MTDTATPQRPSIGRIVLYHGVEGEDPSQFPLPAIVLRVQEDDSVDLHLFGSYHVTRFGVHYDVSSSPQPHTWRWPPRV